MLGLQKIKIEQVLIVFIISILMISCSSKDDDGTSTNPVNISIQDLSIQEDNVDKNAFVRLQLNTPSDKTITAFISSNNLSAEAGADFVPFENDPVIFEPGNLNKDYQVRIKGDEEFESNEEFEIKIISVEGNATIAKGTALISILNDDPDTTSSIVVIPTSGYSTPDNHPNMNLIWQDEFDGDELKGNYWTHQIGNGTNYGLDPGWGNQELQFYKEENTSILDGHLVIEAQKETTGPLYTSSRITTRDKFEFQYGRVDIRAAMPVGKGYWPALWMLGSNIDAVSWPACGEIDIAEINGSLPSTLNGTVHWEHNNGHAEFGTTTTLANGTFADKFHVFSIIWNSQEIIWLIDDVQFHVIDITPADLSEFHQPFFFTLNVAIGGWFPGAPDSTTPFPQQMIVDYIRVFQ